MSGFKKTTIAILKGNNRDGISVQDETGRRIAVFRGKKYKEDKVVTFDSDGTRLPDKFVSRTEGNKILAGTTAYAAEQIQGTAFQKTLPAKHEKYLAEASAYNTILVGYGHCKKCGKKLQGCQGRVLCDECRYE
jgi:hypothetical protein